MFFLTLFLHFFVVSWGGTHVVPGTEGVKLSKAFVSFVTVFVGCVVVLGSDDWEKAYRAV